MARTIQIELTDEQETEAQRVFAVNIDPQGCPGGWADEASFWNDVVAYGLDIVRALQHRADDTAAEVKAKEEAEADDDGLNLPF